jgi:N-glycosylase/DNA lyase
MGMGLESAISELKEVVSSHHNGTPLYDIVSNRVAEFKKLGFDGFTVFDFSPFLDIKLETGIFAELCFCFLTANSSAELGIKIQAKVGDEGFRNLKEEELARIFREMGHRYPEIRAHYITLARNFQISQVLNQKDGKKAREILINLKGIGWKESSHFLRNVGFDDVAIVDRHIYRFLVRHKLVPFQKTITPRLYLMCEKVLEDISKKLDIPLSALDLFIFYKQAGVVLK